MLDSQRSARLLVRDAEGTRTIVIDHLPFTIGRHKGSDLSLPNLQVSRNHALIHSDGNSFAIQDVGSRHGIRVNGLHTPEARLRSGDRIQLGTSDVVLLFLEGSGDSTARNLIHRISSSAASELEKLSLFLEAAQSFSNTRGLHDVLATMVDYTLRLTGAERGFVFLGESPESFTLECGRNSSGAPLLDDFDISRSIVRDAAGSDSEYILGDTLENELAVGRQSIVAHELRSVVAIPLRGRTHHLLGLLYLDSRLYTSDLSGVGRGILHAIAQEAATLVENARMVEAERAASVMRKELEIAASMQRTIISRQLPSFPYALVLARTVPCTEVGGDFYDIVPTPDGFVAVVADVSGKGTSAALLASVIQGMMYAQITTGAPLATCVSAVNDFLCARVPGPHYVTLVAVRYRSNGEIEFVNGGHLPPLLVASDGQVTPLTEGDMPVGMLEKATFHGVRALCPLGGRIILLSDGITETEDARGAQFGSGSITAELTAADPVHALFTAIERFSGGASATDDRTVLTIERTA